MVLALKARKVLDAGQACMYDVCMDSKEQKLTSATVSVRNSIISANAVVQQILTDAEPQERMSVLAQNLRAVLLDAGESVFIAAMPAANGESMIS